MVRHIDGWSRKEIEVTRLIQVTPRLNNSLTARFILIKSPSCVILGIHRIYQGSTMKIALCKSQFFGPVSGADEPLVSYAISLQRAGYDVDVVLLYKPADNDRFGRRLRQAGIPVINIIDRSIALTILRGLRHLVSSFLLLFLLIPSSEA